MVGWLVGWLCFTSHRLRDHLATAPQLLSLAKDVKLGFTPFPPGIEPRAVAWQSITRSLKKETLFAGIIVDLVSQKGPVPVNDKHI